MASAADPVDLGTASRFAVLAGTGITNTGATTIGGDIGSAPEPSVTGEETIAFTGGGVNQGNGGVTTGAKADLVEAFNEAAGAGPTTAFPTPSAGTTLVAGVYNVASTMAVTGELTLTGDADDVFIFQAGEDLDVASGSTITLTGGAQACNVFWQVGSSADLDTGARFSGTIMALTSITVGGAVTVDGRLLARNGTVTLINDTITVPQCAGADDEGDDAAGDDAAGDDAAGDDAAGDDAAGDDAAGDDAAGDDVAGDGNGDGDGNGNGNGGKGDDAAGGGSETDAAGNQVRDVPLGAVDTGSTVEREDRVTPMLIMGALLAAYAGANTVGLLRKRRPA